MIWSNAALSKVQFLHPLNFPLTRLPLSARSFLGHYPSLFTPPLPVTQRGIGDSPGHWAGSFCFTPYKWLRVALSGSSIFLPETTDDRRVVARLLHSLE